MNILMIGDVVSEPGCQMVRKHLSALKKLYGVQMVIANGENSAKGNGVTPQSAMHLFDSGVDVITLGNHTFRRKEIGLYLDETAQIVRPMNYSSGVPGRGYCTCDFGRVQVAVISLMGQVYMEPIDSPFTVATRTLEQIKTPIVMVDFHAEANGEKGALGYYLDGKVSAVLGTHTHVQTADARVLPQGTGFISDVGMTGPTDSILGVSSACIVRKMTTHLPTIFTVPDSPCHLNAVLLEVEDKTGGCKAITPITIT